MANRGTVQFDFSEVEALARRIGERPAEVRREVSGALGRSIDSIHSAAVAAAPFATGELKESIRKSEHTGMTRAVWTNVRQGFFQEFGTSKHPPQPWLTPALHREAPRFVGEIRGIVSRPL